MGWRSLTYGYDAARQIGPKPFWWLAKSFARQGAADLADEVTRRALQAQQDVGDYWDQASQRRRAEEQRRLREEQRRLRQPHRFASPYTRAAIQARDLDALCEQVREQQRARKNASATLERIPEGARQFVREPDRARRLSGLTQWLIEQPRQQRLEAFRASLLGRKPGRDFRVAAAAISLDDGDRAEKLRILEEEEKLYADLELNPVEHIANLKAELAKYRGRVAEYSKAPFLENGKKKAVRLGNLAGAHRLASNLAERLDRIYRERKRATHLHVLSKYVVSGEGDFKDLSQAQLDDLAAFIESQADLVEDDDVRAKIDSWHELVSDQKAVRLLARDIARDGSASLYMAQATVRNAITRITTTMEGLPEGQRQEGNALLDESNQELARIDKKVALLEKPLHHHVFAAAENLFRFRKQEERKREDAERRKKLDVYLESHSEEDLEGRYGALLGRSEEVRDALASKRPSWLGGSSAQQRGELAAELRRMEEEMAELAPLLAVHRYEQDKLARARMLAFVRQRGGEALLAHGHRLHEQSRMARLLEDADAAGQLEEARRADRLITAYRDPRNAEDVEAAEQTWAAAPEMLAFLEKSTGHQLIREHAELLELIRSAEASGVDATPAREEATRYKWMIEAFMEPSNRAAISERTHRRQTMAYIEKYGLGALLSLRDHFAEQVELLAQDHETASSDEALDAARGLDRTTRMIETHGEIQWQAFMDVYDDVGS